MLEAGDRRTDMEDLIWLLGVTLSIGFNAAIVGGILWVFFRKGPYHRDGGKWS
jgi:hypothetical protein